MGIFSHLFGTKPQETLPPVMESSTCENNDAYVEIRKAYQKTDTPPNSYTVFDLETTGLSPCEDSILEIGAIRYEDHVPVAQYHTYVRPDGIIPQSGYAVNHITYQQVKEAPLFEDVAVSFLDFIGASILMGHNVGFDMRFVQTKLQCNLENEVFDTLPFARRAFPELPSHRLEMLADYLSIHTEAHTALGDCQATAIVFQKCLEANACKTKSIDVKDERFLDQTFVFTGTLRNFTRDEAADLIEKHGGRASGSISERTTFVVAGDDSGSKLAKARAHGVPILTEEEFLALLS